MAKSARAFNFAEAYDELNKIVDKLESGEVDLDTALKDYESGLALAQQCKKYLSQVENRVKVIREKYAEDVTEEEGE